MQFSWIAVGTKKGFENPENPVELLSTKYDDNMRGVMFNDFADPSQSALPIWWDGSKLRFDPIQKETSMGPSFPISNVNAPSVPKDGNGNKK